MGVASTHYVTREFAIAVIMGKIHMISDKDLATVLEDVLHNGFYNFIVVDKHTFEENKRQQWPMPYLDDILNLPERNNAG